MNRPNFDLEAAYKVLNQDGLASISLVEFKQVLRSHGLIAFDREVKVLFDRFDKDKDGFLSYDDFKHEISPMRQ